MVSGGTFEGGKRVAQGSGAVQKVGEEIAINTPTFAGGVPQSTADGR